MTRHLGHLSKLEPSMLEEPGCVCFTWTHDEYYRSEDSCIELHALLYVDENTAYTTISESPFVHTEINDFASLQQIAQQSGVSVINLGAPLRLTPIHIAKPWGQEIWYSGIEARGVSLVEGTPIAWLLDIFGEFIGCRGAPLLLKILDPLPAENLGDLYFEMHAEKIEVYVVTSIDPAAWPDGLGAIRYGFKQTKVAEYASREDFLNAYVERVSAYEACRKEIDSMQREGTGYKQFLESLPQDIQEKEQRLRDQMYEFTELKPLKTGDVVTVRPLVPHSLQHGVRVVEFQTPHYERYILSFGQKVLTQDHWDTEEVFEKANTDAVAFDEPVSTGPGYDLIADFDEFSVTRVRLEPGTSTNLVSDRYLMLIGVQGVTEISGQPISGHDNSVQNTSGHEMEAESAFMVPAGLQVTLTNSSGSPSVYLVAEEA